MNKNVDVYSKSHIYTDWRIRMTRALAILLLLIFNLTGSANANQEGWFDKESDSLLILAGDSTRPDESKKPAAAKKDEEGENCQWACQRWGRKCNVDSRTGKYSCKRSCMKFGKVCE